MKLICARKPHICELCGQLITRGEHYHRQTWAPKEWDGGYWHTSIACRWCCEQFSKYLKDGDEGTPSDWLTVELLHWLWEAGIQLQRGYDWRELQAYRGPLWEAQDAARVALS